MQCGLSFLVSSTLSGGERNMRSDEPTQTAKVIEVPAPTPWPFVTAFGLALLAAGLVTSLAVSVVGFVVVLFGAVGWFRDVLPVSKEESVAVAATPEPVLA